MTTTTRISQSPDAPSPGALKAQIIRIRQGFDRPPTSGSAPARPL